MADPLAKIKAIPQDKITGLSTSLAAKAATTVTDALDTRLDTAESDIAQLESDVSALEPNYPGGAGLKLDGDGMFTAVLDSQLSTSDITTNDVSTTKHGFAPKAPNDTSKFLRGDATWAAPVGGGEAFPVGSVFIAVVSTNPGTLLGYGTWSAFAAGRMLVGLDSGDTDFDTVEETGGAKTVTLTGAQSGVASHTHGVTDGGHVHDLMGFPTATGASTGFTRDTSMSGTPAATALDTSSKTTGITVDNATPANAAEAHSNMPPYIACYMWKRTA